MLAVGGLAEREREMEQRRVKVGEAVLGLQ